MATGSTIDESLEEYEESDWNPLEVNVANEIIRVAVYPKNNDVPVDKVDQAVVGPEVLNSFPFDFQFCLPDSTAIEELHDKQSDATIKAMAAIFKITDQNRNKYSYWMLDVSQELLVTAQRRGMCATNQIRTLNWFLFILKQLQLTSLSREEFFARLDKMLVLAENSMVSGGSEIIPNPWDVLKLQKENPSFVYYSPPKEEAKPKAQPLRLSKERTTSKARKSRQSGAAGSKVKKDKLKEEEAKIEEDTEEEGELFDLSPPPISEKDLMIMVQGLYEIFADRLAYEVIRDVYWEEPIVEVVRLSERILIPKQLPPESINQSDDLHMESDLYPYERPITLAETWLSGKEHEVLNNEMKSKIVQETELQRSKDRFIQPLADAIDSTYFRKIYPDLDGISKFVFVKRKHMNQYRADRGSRAAIPQQSVRARKSKLSSKDRRQSNRRKSNRQSTYKRRSTMRKSKVK